MIGSRKVTLQFSLNWLICVCLVALGLILAFIFGPERWRPILVFTAAILGGSGALIAAINALDSRVAKVEQARRATALDFVHKWNDPQFFHAKKSGREILRALREQETVEDQKRYLEEDPTRLANLFDVLNLFEGMSIAIQTNIADEEAAKRFFRSLVIEYWHITEGFIKARRAERQNVRLLQEFEWLFSQWKN